MNEEISNERLIELLMAKFWRRLAAWIIDQLILGVPLMIYAYHFTGVSFRHLEIYQAVEIGKISILANLFYFITLEGSWAQTVGKRLLGIVVYGEDGRRVNYTSALLRRIGVAIPIINLFDAFAIFATSMKQRIFDVIARTVVVNGKTELDASKFLRGDEVSEELITRALVPKMPAEEVERDQRVLEKLREMDENLEKLMEKGELEEERYHELRRMYRARMEHLKERLKKSRKVRGKEHQE